MKNTRKIQALSLILAIVMLTLSIPLHVFAVGSAPISTPTLTDDSARLTSSPATERKDYSMPSHDKHAYDPFARLESEEETAAYRESVQYVAGSIIYKVSASKGWIGGLRDAYDSEALASLGIDLDSAEEITCKRVDDGFFNDTYEIVYEAKLTGDVWEAVDALSTVDGVVDAQPNYLYEDTAIDMPTDISKNPGNGKGDNGWHLGHYKKAWKHLYDQNITAGEGSIVAVIDTGVDYTHNDLASNMWVNTAELNGVAGADDDGNGYIDDIYGCSTVGATRYHSGDPMDDHGHGTHVAGIIAMTANNYEGGAGAAYGAKIMAIKAGQPTGVFSDTDIAEAIRYAVAMGADVINMSFGGTGKSFLVEEALADAFGKCVLVAAAGNDGLPTADAPEDFMKKADFYPAGYSYVLGVMATDQNSGLASFSNWDYINNGGSAEYELTAPGVDIYSTLPGNQYASWDGTSMAAPMVSAAAALIRSLYRDTETYSSRFIMGQLASATDETTVYTDKTGKSHTYGALDIYSSLTDLPTPNLTVKNTYLFDDPTIDLANDGDGIIDAGEIIDLGLVLRNQWGMAGNVTVTVDATSDGGVANPYIEWITDTVTFENIGTFNEQNNSFVYEDGLLVGTENPIRFKVKEDAINDAHIGFNITITCTNAMDEEDTELYVFEDDGYEMTFYVQRGKSLYGTINEDMTLTKDHYWIVESSVYIPEGVTVTVEPGTQIQFWPSDFDKTTIAYIEVDGDFRINGTEEAPVDMFPSPAFQNYGVEIIDEIQHIFHVDSRALGRTEISYAKILNPRLDISKGDHLSVTQNSKNVYYRTLSYGSISESKSYGAELKAFEISDSVMTNNYFSYLEGTYKNCIFNRIAKIQKGDQCQIKLENCVVTGTNTFVKEGASFMTSSINPQIHLKVPDASISVVGTYNGSKYVLVKNEASSFIANIWNCQTLGSFVSDQGGLFKFSVASALAEARGGYLASPNDDAENQAINTLLKAYFKANDNTDMYISLGQYLPAGSTTYVLADGSQREYNYDVKSKDSFVIKHYMPFGGIGDITELELDTFEDHLLFEFPESTSDETILANFTNQEFYAAISQCYDLSPIGNWNLITGSALLNSFYETDTAKWHKIGPSVKSRAVFLLAQSNYYGTTNDTLIRSIVSDGDTLAGYADIVTDPILTLESPELENIYPFVTEIYLTDTEGNRITKAGYLQDVTVHVKFNRDMDTSVQPTVSYGPAAPYTDYYLEGDFVSPREWVADFTLKGVIDAGMEFFRVKDAVAADDAWLKTGTDEARFAFEVSRTNAEALTMQAVGGENKVELSWTQDDYDTLAGFNVYRSDKADGTFVKLNTRLIPGTIREFTDTDVEPGKEYFYYFTVMGTDLVESIPSNIASATPIDNVKPVVAHSRVTYGNAGEALSFTVTATDNIGVAYVKIFYRVKGTSAWNTLLLSNTEGSKYYGVIAATYLTPAGLEYYLEVSDGTSVVRDGSAASPIRVTVDNSLGIYAVSPSKIYTDEIAGGITATVTGVNFSDTMTLTVGGKTVAYTYISPTQISFTVPAGNHGRCDVKLVDGDRSARLTNAITFTDRNSEAQITSPGEAKAREAIRLPIHLSAEGDIISVMLNLKLDRSLFSSVKFEKAAALGSAYATYNVTSAGVVKVAISSTTAIDLSEPIGYLVLTPNNTVDPISTGITMTSATMNAIPVETLIDCSLEILPNFSFSGKITYYKGAQGIAGVKVTLNNGMSTYTDENGCYAFTGVTTNHVVITVSHSGYVNNAITAMDASMILSDVVEETSSFSEMQLIAADVDGDGMVTPHDASYILQKSVGMIEGEFPGSGEEWAFVGTAVLSLTADKTDVNFTGILLGDVTGDWTADPVEEMD